MKPESPFEQRLRRQRLRTIPPVWREEILERAEEAARAARQTRSNHELTLATAAWLHLRELLWPSPRAWAGLAAVWIGVLIAHLAGPGDDAPAEYRLPVAPSREIRQALHEQRQMLAELSGVGESPESGRPGRPAPQPRSQRSRELKNA